MGHSERLPTQPQQAAASETVVLYRRAGAVSVPSAERLAICCRMAGFASAFAAEIEDWTAEEWVYGGLRGAA